jgi:predicted transcriptional regulator
MTNKNAQADARNEQFLHHFGDVERSLRKRLGWKQSDRRSVSMMIEEYLAMNPYWATDASKLHRLRQIRNVLAHDRSSMDGYPAHVSHRSLTDLESICKRLTDGAKVGERFKRRVTTVALDDSLHDVVKLALEKEFSQFPVLSNGRFQGLLTENGITRWLGRYSQTNTEPLDLSKVEVKRLLKEEEKEVGREGAIYSFASMNDPLDEVMGLFAKHPMLEVVLLTDTGKPGRSPLRGIVTEWDASRHTGEG